MKQHGFYKLNLIQYGVTFSCSIIIKNSSGALGSMLSYDSHIKKYRNVEGTATIISDRFANYFRNVRMTLGVS